MSEESQGIQVFNILISSKCQLMLLGKGINMKLTASIVRKIVTVSSTVINVSTSCYGPDPASAEANGSSATTFSRNSIGPIVRFKSSFESGIEYLLKIQTLR